FAVNGYEGAGIRAIVAEADVNQAAINYHFGSKEGLYRAVLQAALCALMKDDDASQNPDILPREAALRRFVRRQLRPMTARDELSDYVRIFSWETLKPSRVFRKFIAPETAPVFAAATELVRRFLPDRATDQPAGVGAPWAVWAMQRFRSQRRAACQSSAAPQDRRALRGPACRHDRHVGGGRARPPADTGSALGRIRQGALAQTVVGRRQDRGIRAPEVPRR